MRPELFFLLGRALRRAGVPGAQHAFDAFHTVRSTHVVNGVARWLAWLHARHLAERRTPVQHDV